MTLSVSFFIIEEVEWLQLDKDICDLILTTNGTCHRSHYISHRLGALNDSDKPDM